MRKLVLIIGIGLLFCNCKKQETCEIMDTGTLLLKNNTNTTLTIKIDGETFGSIAKYDNRNFEVKSGFRNIYAINETHWWDFSVYIYQCNQTKKDISITE